uniref:Uncharacterized protein n=1 Tax=Canis lupus dingo TaxID=286419 RepID=A0A8C0LI72_CANLU
MHVYLKPEYRRLQHYTFREDSQVLGAQHNYLYSRFKILYAIGAPHFHHQLLHLLESPARAGSPPPRGGLRAQEAQPPPPPPPLPPPRSRTPPGSGAAVTAATRARRRLTARSEAAPHRK